MLSNTITNVHAHLGALAGRIPEDQWALVQECRKSLAATAELADNLEKNLLTPDRKELENDDA